MARRKSTFVLRTAGAIASSTAAILCLGTGVARAEDPLAYQIRDPQLQVPPLGAPDDFLPNGDVVPSQPTPSQPTQPDIAPSNRPKPRIELRLSERRVYIYMDDKVETSYPVAVGKPGWETPVGEFDVRSMAIDPTWENPWTGELVPPGPDSPIGRAVIVFYDAEDDWVAFHGTPNEELIGQAVSHGCVRMRNEDILAMYEQVSRGTPVVVLP